MMAKMMMRSTSSEERQESVGDGKTEWQVVVGALKMVFLIFKKGEWV